MLIAHISAEFAGLAKAGGLGDVVAGLSKAQACSHPVCVLLPLYPQIKQQVEYLTTITAHTAIQSFRFSVFQTYIDSVRILALEANDPCTRFHEHIYGDDEHYQFPLFCRLAVETITHLNLSPKIIHLHDWSTALAATLIKKGTGDYFKDSKVILTIHNIDNQGWINSNIWHAISGDFSWIPDRSWQNHDTINLLSQAIIYADHVVAVSPTYSHEIQTPLGGKGLERLFTEKHQQSRLHGILNGLDTCLWSIFSSPVLKTLSDSKDWKTIKKEAKELICQKFGLDTTKTPLCISITRLVPQKGLDLIELGLELTKQSHGLFILLGTSPIYSISQHFSYLEQKHYHDPQVKIINTYDEQLSHLLFAAADIFLMPSLFEPCGLTQLIAHQFGCVPIVRATGGLKDTVFDYQTSENPNGFVFDEYCSSAFTDCFHRAIDVFRNHPDKWEKLITNGMSKDYSWKARKDEYQKLYTS